MAGKWPVVASFRVRTMCPSRMDRAVSAIGSLWSSPSTRTVYRPVMDPVTPVPAFYSSVGIIANTLGG